MILLGSSVIVTYVVTAKVRGRWSAEKHAAQRPDVKRFNLKNLGEMEVRKQYQVVIQNRSAALESLNDSEGITRVWDNSRVSKSWLKAHYVCTERKKHTPCLNEECLQFVGQRKQIKMQRLQGPNQNNFSNLNNATRKASRYFGGESDSYNQHTRNKQ